MRTLNALILEKKKQIKFLSLLPSNIPACVANADRGNFTWETKNLFTAIKLAKLLNPVMSVFPTLTQWRWTGKGDGCFICALRQYLPLGDPDVSWWVPNPDKPKSILCQILIRELPYGSWGLPVPDPSGPYPLRRFPPLSDLEGVTVRFEENRTVSPKDGHIDRETQVSAEFCSLQHLEELAKAAGELWPSKTHMKENRK